jgi:hypothetical protein
MTFQAGDHNETALFPQEAVVLQGNALGLFPHAEVSFQQPPREQRYWLAVASAEHVRIGRRDGFMQVNHGKQAPLKRIKPGDGVVYYSPSVKMGERDGFQSFTAIGFVRQGDPYLAEMGCGKAYRRDVDWLDAPEQPVRPLLDWLDFTEDRNWGYKLRFGLTEFGQSDFEFLVEILMSELEVVKQRRLRA